MSENDKYPAGDLFNESSFEKIYKRLYQRLFNFSLQFTGDKNISQDLVHEVFMKFWESRDRFENISVDALLFKMTRNMCLNFLKHQKLVQNKNADFTQLRQWEELYRIEFIKDDPYILIEHELEEKIKNILNNLPNKCREVFILSRLNGLKNREIAEKLNLSLKTVEKHISFALRQFKSGLPVLLPLSVIILIICQFE